MSTHTVVFQADFIPIDLLLSTGLYLYSVCMKRIWTVVYILCFLTGDAFSEEAERKFEKYPGQLNNEIS